MTVSSTPPIGLSSLVAEFGGGLPHALSEYVRGGALVPNTGQNGAISATVPGLRLSQFYGSAATTLFTPGFAGSTSVSASFTSGTHTALVRLETNALVQRNVDSAITNLGQWGSPAPTTGIGSNYWVVASQGGGNGFNAGDPLSTVLPLSSVRQWGYTASLTAVRTGTLLVNIYSDAGGTVLVASATFSVSLEVSNV